VARLGEFEFIARLLAPLARNAPAAYGLADDAAALAPAPGCEFVVTKDAVVAGVHFLPDDPPDLIARKALRVNLSDLAAKGATPVGFFMALMLPDAVDDAWLARFVAGLGHDVDLYACPLLGGDTTATPGPLCISITAVGEVRAGFMVRRAGALPGDLVCVTGTIGDAALGVDALKGAFPGLAADARAFLIDRYRLPQPRVAFGRTEAGRETACIDISDGLCADVGHICTQSGVGVEIEETRVPLSPAARAALALAPGAMARVLTGGDDYELAFAVPPANLAATLGHGRKVGVDVTVIGRFVAGAGVSVLDGHGRPIALSSLGYRHR
jgi:thiamine-monophosphate kinase